MIKKIFIVLLVLFISLNFFSCSKEDQSNDLYYLDSDWQYTLDYMTNEFFSIDPYEFNKINDLQPDKQGFIFLKKTFKLPENLDGKNLTLYLGNIQIASEVYFNDCYIGGSGRFPPNDFFDGSKIHTFTISSTLVNKTENTIFIKLWVNGNGHISSIPLIASEEKLSYKIRVDQFVNSKFFLMSSYFMFDLALLYLLLFFLNRKDKEYASFALMTLFSAVYLTNFCICEYPVHFSSKITYLDFQKFFNSIIPIITSYFEVSFIRDYLRRKDNKIVAYTRLILVILSIFFTLSSRTIQNYFFNRNIIYALIGIQVSFGVFHFIPEFKNKSPRCYILIMGFSPIILSVIATFFIQLYNIRINYFIIVLGWQMVIISFLAILLYNFAQLNKRNEYLNANLEKLVEERTTELSYTNKLLEKSNYNLEFEKKRSEREIELASILQQAFLKHELPEFNEWEVSYYSKPLAGVSGDLYDFYLKNNDLNGLGIFDVSGHGISSGLVTMLVKNIIQQEFFLGETENLADVMSFINDRVIEEKGNIENYLTGILLRLKDNKNIEVVNAGHPQPLIYSSKKDDVYYYDNENQNCYGVIGISDFPINFNSVNLEIESGDEILLYTDGILEAVNEKDEAFGKDNLRRAFEKSLSEKTPAKQITSIVNEFNFFLRNSNLDDDITFILLRKK